VRLAARGTREDDDGETRELHDATQAAAIRRQARRLHIHSLIVAALITGSVILLPL